MAATPTEPSSRPPEASLELSRRRLLQTTAAAAGTAAVGTGTYTRRSKAVAPLAVGGLLIGIGWIAHSEYQERTAEDVPDGMTASTLYKETYDDMVDREAWNARNITYQGDLVDRGSLEETWAEAKIAAIEAINNGKTESEVIQAGQDAVDAHATTVKSNFLSEWNEAVKELDYRIQALNDHPDASTPGVFDFTIHHDSLDSISTGMSSLSLPDGSSHDVRNITHNSSMEGSNSSHNITYHITYTSNDGGDLDSTYDPQTWVQASHDGGSVRLLDQATWKGLWDTMSSNFQKVRDELSTYVSGGDGYDGAYNLVQSGEIEPEDLLTAADLRQQAADNGLTFAQSDLVAINAPTDLEREVELYFPDQGATLYGSLAVSSQPSDPISAGDTVNPSTRSEDYYLTYNLAEGNGSWAHYNTGVDGGVLTFTSEPFADTTYTVETSHGETAEVEGHEFSDQGDGTWDVDISGRLENAITDVESVTYRATDGDRWETAHLSETFEVISITDPDGNDVESVEFSENDPQKATNYVTQEEWQKRNERIDELIEKYENADSGGGLFGENWPPGMPDWVPNITPEHAAAGGAAFGGLVIAGATVKYGAGKAVSIILP